MNSINVMRKIADGGIANDVIAANMPYNQIGPSAIGSLVGLFAGKPSKERIRKWDEHPGTSWAPGVGAYRATRKLMDTDEGKYPRGRLLANTLGPSLHLLLAGILGGAAGYYASPSDDRLAGAGAGAAVGAGLMGAVHGLTSLIGTARKRRTAKEQLAADTSKGSIAKSWLIPGYASYDIARRLPSITRREDARNQAYEDEEQD